MVERVEELIQGYLAGVATPDDVAQLESWLVADPLHRRRYARAMRFHARLRQLAHDRVVDKRVTGERSDDAGAVATPTATSASAASATGRLRLRWRNLPTRRWPAWLNAAAVLLLVFGAWQTFSRPTTISAAIVVSAGRAQTGDDVEVVAGTPLTSGTQLTCNITTTVTWPDGSQIDFAPASVVRIDDEGVALHHGRLTADIAPHSATRPFTVQGEHATVIVIGTRFTVAVNALRTAVAVEHGQVRVRARQGDERLLAAGDSTIARSAGFDGRTLLVAASGARVPGAYTTIQAAIDAARPGDTVELLPGVHRGRAGVLQDVLITGGGRPGAPVVLRARRGATLEGVGWNTVRLRSAAWVRLEQLDLRPLTTGGRAGNGIHMEDSQHITVVGCSLNGFAGDGITVSASGHVALHDNRIAGCGGVAAWASGGIVVIKPLRFDTTPGALVEISGNRISRSRLGHPNPNGDWTGGNGITCFGIMATTEERVRIANNLITGNDGSAILSYQLGGLDVVDNTCHHNGRDIRHAGMELAITTPECHYERNLLAPSAGRRAWSSGRSNARVRLGNRVVGMSDLASEILSTSPYVVPVADEDARTDFRLVPDLGAGASLKRSDQ